MTEPQPSPEREALSPALREQIAEWSDDYGREVVHESDPSRLLNCFGEAVALLAYAEGRQAGAQEELKAGMSMLCDDKIAMANQTVKQYRWKLTQMWNRRYKHATS